MRLFPCTQRKLVQKLSVLLTFNPAGVLVGCRPGRPWTCKSSCHSFLNSRHFKPVSPQLLSYHNFASFLCVSFLFQLFGGFISFVDRDGTEGPTPCVCPGAEIMGGERRNRKELILPRMGCNYYHRVSLHF